MARLRVLNDSHIKLECDCGEWVHEIFANDEGKLDLDSFKVSRKKQDPPPAPGGPGPASTEPPAKVEPPKKKIPLFGMLK